MLRLVLGAVLLPSLVPSLAWGHAILIASTPPAGGQVAEGTQTLEFRYNSRIDQGRSRLTLEGTNAHMVLPLAAESRPDVLASTVPLSPGSYVVRWQVLAVDGHLTRGAVSFTVTPK